MIKDSSQSNASQSPNQLPLIMYDAVLVDGELMNIFN
jgi:hypothetical protein